MNDIIIKSITFDIDNEKNQANINNVVVKTNNNDELITINKFTDGAIQWLQYYIDDLYNDDKDKYNYGFILKENNVLEVIFYS